MTTKVVDAFSLLAYAASSVILIYGNLYPLGNVEKYLLKVAESGMIVDRIIERR